MSGVNDRIVAPDDEALAQFLERPVSTLDLSVRSVNCLNGAGVETIGQLVKLGHSELSRYPNVGVKTLREISSALDCYGLRVGMSLSEWRPPETGQAIGDGTDPAESGYAVTASVESAQLPAELQALAYLSSFPAREQAILRNRIFESRLTLEELGQRLGLTRERIRQIERKLLARLERYLSSPESAYTRDLTGVIQAELGAAVPVCRLDVGSLGAEWSSVTSNGDREFLTAFAMWTAGPYTDNAGWLTQSPGLFDTIATSLECQPDTRGWLSAEAVRDALAAEDVRNKYHADVLLHLGYRLVDGGWLPRRNNIPDRAEQVLRYRGAPVLAEELSKLVDSESERSLRNRLLKDHRFKKVSKQGHFALRDWDAYDEYSGVATEIAEEIHRQGGAASLQHLIAVLSERYGVKPSSVYAYTAAPMFVKEGDGNVRLRRPDEPLEIQADPHACPGLYNVEGRWTLRVDVTSETLRGSGRPLQPAIAVLVGCQPGERREFPSPTDEIVISWPAGSAAGPNLGSLKPDIEALGGKEGDFVFLTLGQPRVDVRLIKAESLKDMEPWAELATMIGLSESVGSSVNVLAAIASAIGIGEHRGSVDAEEIHARLMQRNEVALAHVIGDQLPDASEDILNRLENMLGL